MGAPMVNLFLIYFLFLLLDALREPVRRYLANSYTVPIRGPANWS